VETVLPLAATSPQNLYTISKSGIRYGCPTVLKNLNFITRLPANYKAEQAAIAAAVDAGHWQEPGTLAENPNRFQAYPVEGQARSTTLSDRLLLLHGSRPAEIWNSYAAQLYCNSDVERWNEVRFRISITQ